LLLALQYLAKTADIIFTDFLVKLTFVAAQDFLLDGDSDLFNICAATDLLSGEANARVGPHTGLSGVTLGSADMGHGCCNTGILLERVFF
jgi:hypothetical protein